MITHRMSTRMQPEPPVRFYKTIAITFLFLTILLLAVVIFFTSKKATIIVVAKSDNKSVTLSVDAALQSTGVNSIKASVSSTEFYWNEKYYPTGNESVDGLATGKVTLYNDSSLAQPLITTTRLLSPKGILFRLNSDVTVPANGTVEASVYADKKGSSSDIDPTMFTIPGLSEIRQKTVYAKSVSKMTGGVRKVGVLTDSDLQAAKSSFALKVQQVYKDKMTNASSTDDTEQVVLVQTNSINSDKKSGEQVDGFNVMGTSTVITVTYSKDELQKLVNQEISNKIDTTVEKILSVGTTPKVTLTNYDAINRVARFSVYQDVLVTLDVDANKLAVVNFFGKSKDEVKRYIMGLSHVVGVDVKFSPSWMRNAPNVSDKIKVVVKNVK